MRRLLALDRLVQAQGLHQAVSVLLLLLSLLLLLLQLLLLLLLYSLFGELYDACKGVRAHARTNTHTKFTHMHAHIQAIMHECNYICMYAWTSCTHMCKCMHAHTSW